MAHRNDNLPSDGSESYDTPNNTEPNEDFEAGNAKSF